MCSSVIIFWQNVMGFCFAVDSEAEQHHDKMRVEIGLLYSHLVSHECVDNAAVTPFVPR